VSDLTERACPVCSHTFMPYRSGGRVQTYCSVACASRADVRRLPPQRCEECGEAFVPKDRRGRWCSPICCGRSRERHRPARPARGKRVARPCEWCGDQFTSRVFQQSRFCSIRCAGAAASRQSCPVPWAECRWCGHWFVRRGPRKYCSKPCLDANHPGRRRVTEIAYGDCRRCGLTFVRRAAQIGEFCSQRCSARSRENHRRHLVRSSSGGEFFSLREVAERDRWRCHLCGRKVPDREYQARDRDPTIDHLVPVADGGSHTLANVALAHNRCNWERQTGGDVQLRLVG
jgi:hypothetical protein